MFFDKKTEEVNDYFNYNVHSVVVRCFLNGTVYAQDLILVSSMLVKITNLTY